MSELTLSLKNKKNNQGGLSSNQQVNGRTNETAANYSNLIKPLISGRNVGGGAGGPQTTKHTPN